MLPTLHHGQRIPICHANAKEIRSPSSDQTFAKEIGAPPQSLQICLVNKCLMTFENSVMTLEQPYGH